MLSYLVVTDRMFRDQGRVLNIWRNLRYGTISLRMAFCYVGVD